MSETRLQSERGGGAENPPVAGVTAREIALGTGLSLSATYRALRHLEAMGVVIRTPGKACDQEHGTPRASEGREK